MSIPRASICVFCLFVIWAVAGCGRDSGNAKSEVKAHDIADSKEAQSAETRTEKTDLSSHDLPITLDAPIGAKISQVIGGDGAVVSGDGFHLLIEMDADEMSIENKESAVEETIRKEGNGVIYRNSDSGIQFTMTIDAGNHRYWCYSQDTLIEAGAAEEYTLEEVEFMLKCARSIQPKLVDGKPLDVSPPQMIPAGYPPKDPSAVEIQINADWISIGGYRVREGKTKPEDLDRLLGEPESFVELLAYHIYFYEQLGVRYYHQFKYSKYIGHIDIYLNLDPMSEYANLEPPTAFPGRLMIKDVEIKIDTTSADLLKSGFKKQSSDYVLDLDPIYVRASMIDGEDKIEFIRVK